MIVFNALRTPDGTMIVSRSRHDYKTHVDANGKTYVIDGGHDYIRCSANGDEVMVTVNHTDDHAIVRKHASWGTYGINGDDPYSIVTVAEMDTSHLEAVIQTCHGADPDLLQIMSNELEYRLL